MMECLSQSKTTAVQTLCQRLCLVMLAAYVLVTSSKSAAAVLLQ